jgi:hypothetical protein
MKDINKLKYFERILKLVGTGMADISTNKLTLFIWKDNDGTDMFEVVDSCDGGNDEENSKRIENPRYQGKDFGKALKELEKDIDS